MTITMIAPGAVSFAETIPDAESNSACLLYTSKAWDHFYYGLPLESHEEARYRKELAFWIRTLIEIAELDIFTK